MSMFGERYHMETLEYEIENFFDNGGTLEQFFEVLKYYFEDRELNQK